MYLKDFNLSVLFDVEFLSIFDIQCGSFESHTPPIKFVYSGGKGV